MPAAIFLAEIAALSTIVCLAFHGRRALGLAPFYLLVGLIETFLFVVNKPSIQLRAELFWVEPRGLYLAFLATLMVSGVLVYVLRGTDAARRFIIAIAILYIVHGAIDIAIEYHATHPPPGDPWQGKIDLVWYQTHARLASLVAMVCDMIVIIIVYQLLRNRLPKVPLAIPLYAALIVGMITDAAVFKLVRHFDLSWSIFHIGAKAQAGAAAGIPAAILFAIELRRGEVQGGILQRDAFEIVDLRSKVAQMKVALADQEAQYADIKQHFSEYVSAEVVNTLLENPDRLNLGGELRQVTVLFADIRGYSSLSETLAPTELIELLNRYFSRVGAVILNHNGMINEFEGDAVLAVFGAPLDHPRQGAAAIEAVLDIQQAVVELNDEWRADGTLDRWKDAGIDCLEVRIGVHTGPAVAGNIGTEERKKYAVIGDTVNTASRVEGLNKRLESLTLITDTTYETLPPHLAEKFEDRGEHRLRGRMEPVRVYELAEPPGASHAERTDES